MLFGKTRNKEDYYLKKAIGGEREGFEYLVATYQKLAYTLAIKICGNKEDAEEVVQDSFMKAFRGLADFRSAAKFSTWLYKIVYHTALTKKNNKRMESTELTEDSEMESYLLDEKNEISGLVQSDKKRYVDLALSRLGEEERSVITLHYLGEKSISEIAEILNIGKSAVKMRLVRGRKKLEQSLRSLLGNEIKDL